jgi:hypothetical protein
MMPTLTAAADIAIRRACRNQKAQRIKSHCLIDSINAALHSVKRKRTAAENPAILRKLPCKTTNFEKKVYILQTLWYIL